MVRTTHAPLLPSVEQITGRVSTSPQPNNNTPRRYKLPPIERNLRGKEYSGTFNLRHEAAIDVPNYSAKERAKFVDNFTAEVNNKFSGRQTNKKQKVENDHMARVFEKLMAGGSINDDGVPGGIAEIRHCSRYKVEDIIRQSPPVGSEKKHSFILAIHNSIVKERNSPLKKTVQKKQKQIPGSWKSGYERRLNNEMYIFFKCHLVPNEVNDAINKCEMSYNDFMSAYDDGRGFEVQFENVEGECGSKHFAWRHLIEDPMKYLFFGSPLTATLTNNRLFDDAWDVNYIHHIFVQMARECWGDAYASAALLSAYLGKLLQEKERNVKTEEGSFKSMLTTLNFRGKAVTDFFKQVNDTIKERVLKSVTTMQYYTEPIIDYDVIAGWIKTAKDVFPKLWLILGSLRGINEGLSRGNDLIKSKWNQVLFQLFSLARMANPKNLIWFSFVQAVSNFGRGVPASAVNNFFGNICSNTFTAVAASSREPSIILRMRGSSVGS
jgi:hypothetical protein